MTRWEQLRDVFLPMQGAGREWLGPSELTREVQSADSTASYGSIRATLSAYCINDPSKKHFPGLVYRRNPQFITDDPTMRGKRFRLMTDAERAAYLSNPRDDLETISYAQLLEWLTDPQRAIEPQAQDDPLAEDAVLEADVGYAVSGPALLELHLQDYIYRHWSKIFPEYTLYQGGTGREFRTSDPGVGILDFLCTDRDGNFIVIETKRETPDRQAIGQTLGYMGWVKERLCKDRQTVRGVLIASEASDQLRMAAAAVPGLDLYVYEISFEVRPA